MPRLVRQYDYSLFADLRGNQSEVRTTDVFAEHLTLTFPLDNDKTFVATPHWTHFLERCDWAYPSPIMGSLAG